ncbi:PTS beta-glucoside transporter subunit EIIBCA [Lachnospiraceae bacterium oral taxon 500]|nr:PTS beta-glucoside transporter subunit EIIBCA [Lachnospiraceae bacterium oral taxon 500]
MAKDYSSIAKAVVKLIGGESNVTHFEHCSTRLRFSVADLSKVDQAGLKGISGVMGVVASGNQCQVVIGNDVIEVFDEIKKIAKFGGSTSAPVAGGKKNIGPMVLDFMVGVFQPLVPAIAGGGILKAFLALLSLIGVMNSSSVLYQVLMNVADAPLYFLPVLVAVTMATKIGCNKLTAVAAVGALLLPKTAALIGAETPAVLFGLKIQNVNYAYQVFPAILAVAALYFIEKYVTRITPKPIRVFFVPMVCFAVVFPLTLLLLGPIGLTFGKGLTAVILTLYKYVGWLAVGLVAAILPLMISVGAHKAFIPYLLATLGDLGYEILYMGASLAHNISEGGAALAVACKTKNAELRSAAFSSGVSAIFGITEPAIYSVTLQHKKALYGVMIGSFVSGSFIGMMGVKAFVAMGPGLAGMAMYVDPENGMNIIWAFAGFGIALAASFIATFLLYKDEAAAAVKAPAEQHNDEIFQAPLTGKMVDITEVPDAVFSAKILGEGVAIIPDKGELYAPADGVIETVFEYKHAIAMTCDNGAEVLLHVGIDTVKLEGKYYEAKVKSGDRVKAGQLLMEFDIDKIRQAGYDVVTPIVVTNHAGFQIEKGKPGPVEVGAVIMNVSKEVSV